MLKRTLFFTTPGSLSIKLSQLVFDSKAVVKTIPVEDIGFIIIETPQIMITSYCLQYLAQNSVAVVLCDDKHIPSSMLYSFSDHTLTQKHISSQLSASDAVKKRFWKQTVQAKIINQANCLARFQREYEFLRKIAEKVKSGDPDNIEGIGARYYFKTIKEGFLRDRDDGGINAALNYGYAIIRAAMARALVGAGLLCVCGIHHCNQYNAFALADDIMEPYRPWVDELVFADGFVEEEEKLTTRQKSSLLALLASDVWIGENRRPMMNAMSYTSASLVRCFLGEDDRISYPGFDKRCRHL